MENKKSTLVILLCLLSLSFIFLVIGIFGKLNGYAGRVKMIENTKKQFKFNNSLYFYNQDKELLYQYPCENKSCDYAEQQVTSDYFSKNKEKTNLINDRYAFVKDKNIILLDLKKQKKLAIYQSFTNYFKGIGDSLYIVQSKDGKYGLISLKDNFEQVISNSYEFLGLNYSLNSDLVYEGDKFIAELNKEYFIINQKNEKVSSVFNKPIVNFSPTRIVVVDEGQQIIYDYESVLINSNKYKFIDFIDNYTVFVNSNNYIFITNNTNNKPTSDYLPLLSNDFYKISTKYPPFNLLVTGNVLQLIIYSDAQKGDNKIYKYDV